jgi:aldehyde dehydrogenase (NAD+)
MKAAAEHLTSVTLELGGKSPVIVDETANIEDAAEKIAWGKFINAGQTCVAPDYLFVHKSKETEFLSHLKQSINKLFGGTTSGKSADYARIVNTKHWNRVQNLIADAIQKGANVQTGGITDETDHYISPTVLTQPCANMQVMQEEIFGPVLPIISYTSIQEVADFISSREKPLALYIFSNNKNTIRHILTHTSSGGASINDCVIHYVHPNLPFGGVNNSGIGKAHGHYGFLAFSNERAILKQRIGYTTIKMLYPPYTAKVKKLIDLTLKWL